MKIISVCLFILFFILIVFGYQKIKEKEEFGQKVVLAQETRKALGILMLNLSQANENTLHGVPVDGLWHEDVPGFVIKEGHLIMINHDQSLLIANHIIDLRIRRQRQTPDILELRIEAKKDVSLVSNLKIRIHE